MSGNIKKVDFHMASPTPPPRLFLNKHVAGIGPVGRQLTSGVSMKKVAIFSTPQLWGSSIQRMGLGAGFQEKRNLRKYIIIYIYIYLYYNYIYISISLYTYIYKYIYIFIL